MDREITVSPPANVEVAEAPLTLINVAKVEEELTVSFFFNDTATTEIYTLSLHDALPILPAKLEVAEFEVSCPEIVVEPVTEALPVNARLPEIAADPPKVRLPVSLM